MLSELHFCEEDRRYPEDCRPQVVYIEEFALLQWCKVSFLLNCPTRMRWEEGGRQFQTASDRIFGIQLSNDQELYTWVSIYAPVQSERAERKTFFDQLDGYLKTVPHERLCIGGDWNGHMGNDTVQHGLPVRTTSGGLEVQQFLAQHHFLQVADHQYPIKNRINRGTWRHSMNRAWYELDYMLTTTDMIKRLQNARVQPYTFSDHMAKVLCFHLCPASKRQWAGQKFHTAARYKQPPTTDYTAMRGPTPAARQIRSHMQQEMEQRLQPWLPHMHIAPQPHLPTITIFVDGSFTGPPGTSPQHHKAGWGIHIPQHNISFCDRVTTDSTHPRWVGATHLSNNPGSSQR